MPAAGKPSNNASGGESTRTVTRALDLLAAVAEQSRSITLSELARATELSPATASRLLSTLAGRDFVRRDEGGGYRPGYGLMQLAAAVLRGEPLYELAGPHLTSLAEQSQETSNLGIPFDDDHALYLRQARGDQRVQTASWVGRTIPREGTAMGKALDGKVGADGYTASSGRVERDVTAIAAPVRDYDGAIVAALSILAPTYRTDKRRLARHGRLLVEHARLLSSALGARD